MRARNFLPLTWFCFGIIAADCVVTIVLLRLGWAYEANKLFSLIDLPIDIALAIKFAGAAIGLIIIEYFRFRYEYARKSATRAITLLAIIYGAVMAIAWTNFVVQFVRG